MGVLSSISKELIGGLIVVGLSISGARAQSSESLAGTWFGRGSVLCGAGDLWKLEANGNRFRLERLEKKAANVPNYEGRVKDARLLGEAYLDYSGFVNGELFSQPFIGTVSGDGRTLTIIFRTILFAGMVGNRITGWKSFELTCTYNRAD